MTGGVVFIIIIPTENYEEVLRNSKSSLIEFKNDDRFKHEYFSSQENLMEAEVDNDISIQKKPALNKSKSIDIPTFEETTNVNKIMYKSWAGTGNKNEEENDSFSAHLPLEKILRIILKQQKIKNASWFAGQNENYIQVVFPMESGNCEATLAFLNEYGIGQRLNSVVSVIPCCLYYKESECWENSELKENEEKFHIRDQAKHSAWTKFMSSIRSRLTVAQVVESVSANAQLTFDFLILLLIATIMSAIALVENNIVFLVSSMLISPMMGPVMAGTFGRVIQDWKLQKVGIKNEIIGLGIATAVGFCYGCIVCVFFDKYGVDAWPSPEMVSRGELRTLWVGCLIALLSGAAVALGILGDNIASLVGVAMSTSLMPPAVNAGLLWSMSAVYAYFGEDSYKALKKTNIYFNNEIYELAALGGISMCLTFVNIVFIYIAGILVFKIKEVAPLSSKDDRRRFWKHDIKVTRDFNKTVQNEDIEPLQEFLKEDLAPYSHRRSLPGCSILNMNTFDDHLYQSTEVTGNRYFHHVDRMQNTWSPSTFTSQRPSIKDLRKFYFSAMEKSLVQRNINLKFPTGLSERENYNQLRSDDRLPCIPETVSSEESGSASFPVQNSRKFIVTPAVLDEKMN